MLVASAPVSRCICHCEIFVSIATVPAEIIIHPPATGIYSNSVILTCVGYGSPIPTVTWHRNGAIITNSSGVNIYYSQVTENSITFSHSLLEFCPLLAGQDGMLRCEATNSQGTHGVDFQITRSKLNLFLLTGSIERKRTCHFP